MKQFPCTVLAACLLVARVASMCSDEQQEAATNNFKDCMDEKKKSLLAEDSDKDSICSGLAQLAEVCSPAVDSLAGCKGREYADNLVAIHVNSMSAILSAFHPDVNLRDCPVLATPPPPTIVHTGAGEDSSDQAAYVTSPAPAPALAASLGLVLAAVARLL